MPNDWANLLRYVKYISPYRRRFPLRWSRRKVFEGGQMRLASVDGLDALPVGDQAPRRGVEVRFETPPGRQAQVDFAQFRVEFSDEPGVVRILWLFTMVLGHSRWLTATSSPADAPLISLCDPNLR